MWHSGSRKNKSKSSERGNQAKSRGSHGRKYQAEGNKVGWEAESKSVQRDGIKAEECHGTSLLILDSLIASQEGKSARHHRAGCCSATGWVGAELPMFLVILMHVWPVCLKVPWGGPGRAQEEEQGPAAVSLCPG